MNAIEIELQKNDFIQVRRTNEKKFREGMILSIDTQFAFGIEATIAEVSFDKVTEIVNLSKAEVRLHWRLES